jgi:hypothetical protein
MAHEKEDRLHEYCGICKTIIGREKQNKEHSTPVTIDVTAIANRRVDASYDLINSQIELLLLRYTNYYIQNSMVISCRNEAIK